MKTLITVLPSVLFDLITLVRNKLFDWGILASTSFEKPRIICVGNLAVGGTGKSPLVSYLVQNWRGDDRLAILSRGYGRKTKGYIDVKVDSTADEVGDEPLAYKILFPELPVVVCEDRVKGVQQMPAVDVLFLDDAFQHRSIKASLNLVCSTFSKPFYQGNFESGCGYCYPLSVYFNERAEIEFCTGCFEEFERRKAYFLYECSLC
jgi:tetraacyldisaccharide 4'-kinase